MHWKRTSTLIIIIELRGPIKLKYFEQDFLIEVSTTKMFNLPSYNHDYALYKNAHYLSVNVFSTKVLIKMGTLFFMFPTGNCTAILRVGACKGSTFLSQLF